MLLGEAEMQHIWKLWKIIWKVYQKHESTNKWTGIKNTC